ncbi:MAG: PQQ-binding-like beta-propeller repeat protein, partial [Chloroflexota bacterium]
MSSYVDRGHRAIRQLALVVTILTAVGCQSAVPAPLASSADATATSPIASASSRSGRDIPALANVPVYKGDAARTGVQAGPGPLAHPVEAWRTNIECAITDHTPVLGSGLLIVGCDAPRVIALDARTGAVRWSADLAGPMFGSAAIDDDALYVSDAGGRLTRRDLATGTEVWSIAVKPFSHPVIVAGRLYVGTRDGRVLGLDPADGSERWSWQAPSGVGEIIASVAEDAVYASADDGNLYSVSLKDGTERWHHHVLSGRVSSPAVSSDTVFVSALQSGEQRAGGLYALDPDTGKERWRFESPSGDQAAPPTFSDGVVYAPSRNDGLFALDAATGSVRWSVPGIG